jgi:hypothetical protein
MELSNRSDSDVAEANRMAIDSARQLTVSRQSSENTATLRKRSSDMNTDYLGEAKDALAGTTAAAALKNVRDAGGIDNVVKASSGGMGLSQIAEGAMNTGATLFRKIPAEAVATTAEEVAPAATRAAGSAIATTNEYTLSAAEHLQRAQARLRFLDQVGTEPNADVFRGAEVARSSAAPSADAIAGTAERVGGEAVANTTAKFGAMDALGALPGAIDAFQDLTNTKNGQWAPTLKGDNWQEKASNALGVASTVLDFVPGMEWAGAAGNLVSAGLGAWGEAKDQAGISTKDTVAKVATVQPNLQAGLNFHAMGMVANQSNNAMNSIHTSTGVF